MTLLAIITYNILFELQCIVLPEYVLGAYKTKQQVAAQLEKKKKKTDVFFIVIYLLVLTDLIIH